MFRTRSTRVSVVRLDRVLHGEGREINGSQHNLHLACRCWRTLSSRWRTMIVKTLRDRRGLACCYTLQPIHTDWKTDLLGTKQCLVRHHVESSESQKFSQNFPTTPLRTLLILLKRSPKAPANPAPLRSALPAASQTGRRTSVFPVSTDWCDESRE